jgi:hypothetical protein
LQQLPDLPKNEKLNFVAWAALSGKRFPLLIPRKFDAIALPLGRITDSLF